MGASATLLGFSTVLISSGAFAADYFIKFKTGANTMAERQLPDDSGLKTRRYIPELGIYVAKSKDEALSPQVLTELMHSSDILYIEKDEAIWRAEGIAPRDPLYPSQGEMRNTQLERAWSTTTGSKNIVVAVVDTGVDYTHPDLKSQIWTNPKEIPGNGIDDDNNGFVDDVHGWDFNAKDNDPMDENSHGTHVSGIIGAEANNGVGIAGVNWNVSIMPLRFLGKDGSGSIQGGLDAILYAANNGARVVNASWGGYGSSNAMRDAIAYAGSKGTLVICAAGNETNDTDTKPHYPSSYRLPNVLEIAAVDDRSKLASFSNWGLTTTSFAAPGVEVLSSVPGGEWERMSGTSMATPVVSGVAALMLAKAPGLSLTELRNGLLNAVVSRSVLEKITRTGGEIDAAKAVEQLSDGFQVWPQKITVRKGDKFAFTSYHANGSVKWTSSAPGVAGVSEAGEITAAAIGEFDLVARDSSGASSRAKVSVVDVNGKPSKPGSGVGCASVNEVDTRPYESRNAMLSFGAPFALAFLLRRRRKI